MYIQSFLMLCFKFVLFLYLSFFNLGISNIVSIQSIPNDSNFGIQWALNDLSPGSIGVTKAWDVTKGKREVVIAVIDTGVDYNHPDLINNIWVNSGEINGNGIDDDGNGFIDDIHGYDFLGRDADPMDTNGHGTHVAGIIAAQGDNGIGISGVAPNIKIMPIRAVGGTTLNILQAINYVNLMKSKGVNIVASNNSYAFSSYNDGIKNAIAQSKRLGILFVASAGNNGVNNDLTVVKQTGSNYPAVFDLNNILSVAATTSSDTLSLSSNYGKVTVDLAAPGASIYSTVLNSGYSYYTGTSMAAPHVTGVIALLASIHPDWTAQQIKQRILSTVKPLPTLTAKTLTGGRLDASKAVL